MSPAQLQLTHDDLVRQEALRLLREGYQVTARIDGWFEPPKVILGYRPDIVAEREGRILIVEVKKGPGDWPKDEALKRYAIENHCDFELRELAL